MIEALTVMANGEWFSDHQGAILARSAAGATRLGVHARLADVVLTAASDTRVGRAFRDGWRLWKVTHTFGATGCGVVHACVGSTVRPSAVVRSKKIPADRVAFTLVLITQGRLCATAGEQPSAPFIRILPLTGGDYCTVALLVPHIREFFTAA